MITVKEVSVNTEACSAHSYQGAQCRCVKTEKREVADTINIVVQAETLPMAILKAQKYLEVEDLILTEQRMQSSREDAAIVRDVARAALPRTVGHA